MKAKLLLIVAACCASIGAHAQSLPKPTVPTPAPLAPVATAPVKTPPPPMGAPSAGPTAPVAPPMTAAPAENAGPRNPLMRPTAPAPQAAPVMPSPMVQAPNKLGPPGLPGMPGLQNATDEPDVDPVKASGKRIGRINGSDIYKHEDAYYFDAPAKPKK